MFSTRVLSVTCGVLMQTNYTRLLGYYKGGRGGDAGYHPYVHAWGDGFLLWMLLGGYCFDFCAAGPCGGPNDYIVS